MMAAPKRKVKVWAYPILTLFLLGLGFFIYCHPYSLLLVLAFGIVIWLETVRARRYRRRLAVSRSGESICTFVEGFNCHQTDTWVLRAVYEELSKFLAVDGRPLPVRADDRCCERDLKIDPEDLDDLAVDIAFRARRSMKNTKQNPFYGRVKTVRDMVSFFEFQPRVNDVKPVA
jgi:hypothetical protein